MFKKHLFSTVSTAAAVSALIAMGAQPAMAADSDVQKRLEAIEKELKGMKGDGDEAAIRAKEKNISLSIGGQVNRAVVYADDGKIGDFHQVDNDQSSSRIKIDSKARLTNKISAGAKWEIEMESNTSGSGSQTNAGASEVNNVGTNAADDIGFTQRKIEIWFEHNDVGKVSLGQGDMASNKSAESDLSGTTVATFSDRDSWMGNYEFRTKQGNGLGSDAELDDVANEFDGLSRLDRIRFDTARVYGFALATSFAEEGLWDIAGTYKNKWKLGSQNFKVAGAIAYANLVGGNTEGGVVMLGDGDGTNGQPADHFLNGSFSILHENSGLNATFAFGRANKSDDQPVPGGWQDTVNPWFWYTKVGYQAKIFKVGKTNFSFDYSVHHNMENRGDQTNIFSFAAVQKLKKWGIEIFAVARRNKFENDNLILDSAVGGVPNFGSNVGAASATDSFDPIWVVAIGSRIKF